MTVYDRMPSVGRKFLMAGRGGLNLTHSEPLAAFIARYGAAADWLAPAIRAFPPEALRAWCEALDQKTFVGSSGRVFPTEMKASPLLRAWLRRLQNLGVHFALRHDWLGWRNGALRFATPDGEKQVIADACLLALGGASWPRLGADGGWTKLLAAEGIPLTPLQPANCGFVVPWSEHFQQRFAGIPLKNITLTHNGTSRSGEAMITQKGLEGGALYALAPSVRAALAAEGSATVLLDMLPHTTAEQLAQKLSAPRGSQSLSTYLRKAAGLSPVQIGLLRETLNAEALAAPPAYLAAQIKQIPIRFTATAGMARAISTVGGVPQVALDEHFMLRTKPGLFVAGEMLDWEAPTGGYLLQGCFSTGMAAAGGIQAFIESGKST